MWSASPLPVPRLPLWVPSAASPALTVSAPVCQVSLNKVGEHWWSAILEGEERIDIGKINKERSMATVDEEEHAVLDRLTFDYHQKLQGKPQSHELVRAPTLRRSSWALTWAALAWSPPRPGLWFHRWTGSPGGRAARGLAAGSGPSRS